MEQFVQPDTIFLVKLFWKENQTNHEETTTLDMQYEKGDAIATAEAHVARLSFDYPWKVTRRGNHWWLSEGGGDGTSRIEIYLLEVPDHD